MNDEKWTETMMRHEKKNRNALERNGKKENREDTGTRKKVEDMECTKREYRQERRKEKKKGEMGNENSNFKKGIIFKAE